MYATAVFLGTVGGHLCSLAARRVAAANAPVTAGSRSEMHAQASDSGIAHDGESRAGHRHGHLEHVRCRQQREGPGAADRSAARPSMPPARSLIDSSPMYGSAEAVTGDLVRQLAQAGEHVLRDQGLDQRPRQGHRADRANRCGRCRRRGSICCRSTISSTGARTSRRCGKLKSRRQGPLRRHHALHGRRACRAGGGAARGSASTSRSSTTRSRRARLSSGCCRSARNKASACSSIDRSRKAPCSRACAAASCPATRPRSAAPAGRSCS